MTKIGILHPGEMGVAIAASAIQSGHEVYWLTAGRSPNTRARAEKHQLIGLQSLEELSQTCETIISICPPDAAEDVARGMAHTSFRGLYLDANAISPERAVRIGQMMEAQGIAFVDGGIIGPPAWTPNETWLYLSGPRAEDIAACFAGGLLETKILGDEFGKASALKMCYAAYTKGTSALFSAILAVAESLDVRQELYQQWEMDEAGFSDQVNRRVRRVTARAWRFKGEMKEIAATFREAGLPDGFHEAAAEVYRRMAGFKDASEVPVLDDVLNALIM